MFGDSLCGKSPRRSMHTRTQRTCFVSGGWRPWQRRKGLGYPVASCKQLLEEPSWDPFLGTFYPFLGGCVPTPPMCIPWFCWSYLMSCHDWRNPRLGHRRLWVDPREGRSLPLRAGGFGLKDVKGAMFSSPAATWRHHTSSHSRSLIFRIPDGVKIVKRKCFRKIEDVENFDCSDFQVGYFLHNQGSRGRLDQQQNWRTSGWHRMSDCYDTSSSNSLILLCSLVWIITKPTHSIYVIYVDIESSWSWLAVGEEHHTMMALKSLNGQLPLQDYFNPKPLAANPVRFVTRLTRLKPGGPIRPVLERSRWWAWFVFGTCSFSVLQGSNISSRHVWQSCMFQCITVTASYIEQHHWLNSPQLSPYPLISWHPTKGFKWWARAASAAAGWWGTSPENAASWRRSMSPPCPNSTGQKPPPKSPCWRNWCIPTSSATETPSWMAACCVSSWTLLSKATSIGSLSGGRSQGPCCQRLWWWGGSPKSCWRWSTCMSATSFTETWRPKISSWQGLGRATWSLATLALLEFCGTPQIVPEHTLGLPTTALQRSAKNNHTATSLMFGPWAAYFMKWQLSGMHLMQILCVTWSWRSCEVCRHKCRLFSLKTCGVSLLTCSPKILAGDPQFMNLCRIPWCARQFTSYCWRSKSWRNHLRRAGAPVQPRALWGVQQQRLQRDRRFPHRPRVPRDSARKNGGPALHRPPSPGLHDLGLPRVRACAVGHHHQPRASRS